MPTGSVIQNLCRDLEALYLKLLTAVERLGRVADDLRWDHRDVQTFWGSWEHLELLRRDRLKSLLQRLDYAATITGKSSHRIRDANERLLSYLGYHGGVSEQTKRTRSDLLGLVYQVREDQYAALSARCKAVYDMSTTPMHFPGRRNVEGRLFLASGDPLRHLASNILYPPMNIDDPFVVVIHGTVGSAGVGFLNEDRTSMSISAEEHAAMLRCDPKFDPNKTIWLVSCNTGDINAAGTLGIDPYAQQLADLTGADVVAPTSTAWLDTNGDTSVHSLSYQQYRDDEGEIRYESIPNMSDPGSWLKFSPRTPGLQ